MKKTKVVTIFTVLICCTFGSKAFSFNSFMQEVSKLRKSLKCNQEKITPADESFGALFGCVSGRWQTVKVFINEEEKNPGRVDNVKLMWNEWKQSPGDGTPVSADEATAKEFARIIAETYVPEMKDLLIKYFMGTMDVTFHSNNYTLKYTYTIGPKISEHLLIIELDWNSGIIE